MDVSRNLYMLENLDGDGYHPATRERINRMIMKGLAEWEGTDYDEDRDTVVHYARRLR